MDVFCDEFHDFIFHKYGPAYELILSTQFPDVSTLFLIALFGDIILEAKRDIELILNQPYLPR